ncbi:LysM peptidoglycan-binding domain-containing protein [Marinobacterium sp. AK62]|uniref:LysM peptidoglycan-binding domain-containing protein n=1 Tax=Marinobacterium alkalitolerans TaxID=1542925 RepID=A0ABS3ZE12_9GAMM|nr:LysM peptidoglycan-binding domain-containing protein [Marinobacterium alkalitolerans]MBP0049943.1 LysM peptidoglycan-binding domain-containing protein [Marinobacterium alkalitolerans]
MRGVLYSLIGSCLLWAGAACADRLQLQDNHPTEYVVVKGDTLWDISGRFLQSPWRWPEVWDVNPQIDNPHLIYPGDVIYLTWVDGQPRLSLQRGVRKLSPQERVEKLDQPIPAIPLRDIASFLNDNRVVQEDVLAEAPYVIGGRNESIIAGAGDRVYARGTLIDPDIDQQSLYRPAREYRHPVTDEFLGYELFKVADAAISAQEDDILTLDLTKTREEVRTRDRLLPNDTSRIQSMFYPKPGPALDDALIIDVLGGVAKVGQYDAVALSFGEVDGVEPGHVFAIYKKGEMVKDPVTGDLVKLPDERAGELMVFRAFDRVSYGLVLRATNVISVGDLLRQP